jgi:hypothetical protein
MTTGSYIRIIAGTFVLASLVLGTWVNHNWHWFTAFVGTNLFQSGFTKWCLMEDIQAFCTNSELGWNLRPKPHGEGRSLRSHLYVTILSR